MPSGLIKVIPITRVPPDRRVVLQGRKPNFVHG
jgi:hypothetical protein